MKIVDAIDRGSEQSWESVGSVNLPFTIHPENICHENPKSKFFEKISNTNKSYG